MIDTLLAIGVIVLVMIVLPVVICLLLDRFVWHRPLSPEEAAAERERYERRVHSPQFAEVEELLGHPIPEDVRRLYEQHELLDEPPFKVTGGSDGREWEITGFLPLDGETLADCFFTGDHGLPFAQNL